MKELIKLERYAKYLFQKELCEGTRRIYIRQVALLLDFLDGRQITKEETIAYKKYLQGNNNKVTTRNVHIVAVNSYLKYIGCADCTIRMERIQKNCSPSNVISKEEYKKMLSCAKESGREKYYYIIQVLVLTGMRVSELSFLTVEVLPMGRFTVENKGKNREIYLSERLVGELYDYCGYAGIEAGNIFLGRERKPISRIAVYKMFIRLSEQAGVPKEKVHPHSFRHLFAVTYIKQYGNLTELADILGHLV